MFKLNTDYQRSLKLCLLYVFNIILPFMHKTSVENVSFKFSVFPIMKIFQKGHLGKLGTHIPKIHFHSPKSPHMINNHIIEWLNNQKSHYQLSFCPMIIYYNHSAGSWMLQH